MAGNEQRATLPGSVKPDKNAQTSGQKAVSTTDFVPDFLVALVPGPWRARKSEEAIHPDPARPLASSPLDGELRYRRRGGWPANPPAPIPGGEAIVSGAIRRLRGRPSGAGCPPPAEP